MKVQNANMEFVTFDAQDVIMTSGGGLTIYYGITPDSSSFAAANLSTLKWIETLWNLW